MSNVVTPQDQTHPPEPHRKGRLWWQLLSFSVIGGVSTVAQLALYALFRMFWPALVANLVSLAVTTLFNTEANRRLTFAGAQRVPVGTAHFQGFVLFVVYYVVTSAPLLIVDRVVRHPTTMLELVVLIAASAIGTLGRFLAFRGWVFKKKET
ncbi:MAG TPA: GtrA family protein [Pseudonocardiaceae bacterium]|jgi:putative flippase GtrA|nr:GtrA family protein [Pseudonocardiaceae bacterium]